MDSLSLNANSFNEDDLSVSSRDVTCTEGNGCTVIYTNLDSFLNKKSELISLIEDKKASIIGLTEIKAKNQKEINISEYHIPGFDCYINSNPLLGVALYVKDSLCSQSCDELNNQAFNESVWCKIVTKEKKKVLIGCLYKSPSTDENNKRKLLELLRHQEIQNFDSICIVGDFNLPSFNW